MKSFIKLNMLKFTTFLVFIFCFGYVSCSSSNERVSFVTQKDVYGFAAASACLLFYDFDIEHDITDAYFDNKILLIDAIVGDNESFDINRNKSDKIEFKNLIEIGFNDLLKTKEFIYFYYNEEYDTQSDNIQNLQDKKSLFSGVIIFQDSEFFVSGNKIIEEGKYSLSLEVSSNNRKIECTFSEDNKQQFFVYNVYENSGLIDTFTLMLEYDDNDIKGIIKKTFKFESFYEFKYRYEDNNGYILIRAEQEENIYNIKVFLKQINNDKMYFMEWAKVQKM